MSEKIVVLKNTKKGLVVDTVYDSKDSLFIDHKTTTTIELPNEPFEVNTYPPGKDGWDILMIVASIVGVIAAVWAAVSAYKQLIKKDEDKQKQLDNYQNQLKELTKLAGALEAQNELIQEGNNNMKNYLVELTKVVQQTGSSNGSSKMEELEEQRFRLLVKPRIWTNGGSYAGLETSVTASIDNRGEICYLDAIEPIVSDDLDGVSFYDINSAIVIEKKGSIRIHGNLTDTSKHPKDSKFRVRLHYHDQENYKYESILEWDGGRTKIVETKELPKDE